MIGWLLFGGVAALGKKYIDEDLEAARLRREQKKIDEEYEEMKRLEAIRYENSKR